MDENRIVRIAFRVTAGKLTLGPRKKKRGRNSISFPQAFKYDPEGWDLEALVPKIIRYLKKPPSQRLPGYHRPQWFVILETRRGRWPVSKWDRRNIKIYQDLVEDDQLTGRGTAGWSFAQESRSR